MIALPHVKPVSARENKGSHVFPMRYCWNHLLPVSPFPVVLLPQRLQPDLTLPIWVRVPPAPASLDSKNCSNNCPEEAQDENDQGEPEKTSDNGKEEECGGWDARKPGADLLKPDGGLLPNSVHGTHSLHDICASSFHDRRFRTAPDEKFPLFKRTMGEQK